MNIYTVTTRAASSAAVMASQTPSILSTMGSRMTAASWNNRVRRNEISALVTPSPRAVKNEEP